MPVLPGRRRQAAGERAQFPGLPGRLGQSGFRRRRADGSAGLGAARPGRAGLGHRRHLSGRAGSSAISSSAGTARRLASRSGSSAARRPAVRRWAAGPRPTCRTTAGRSRGQGHAAGRAYPPGQSADAGIAEEPDPAPPVQLFERCRPSRASSTWACCSSAIRPTSSRASSPSSSGSMASRSRNISSRSAAAFSSPCQGRSSAEDYLGRSLLERPTAPGTQLTPATKPARNQ